MKFIVSVMSAFDADPAPRFYGPIEAVDRAAAQRVLEDSPLVVGDDEDCDLFEVDPLPL